MSLIWSYICKKEGVACPFAGDYGECKRGTCFMQEDDNEIDELNLYDMLDEE